MDKRWFIPLIAILFVSGYFTTYSSSELDRRIEELSAEGYDITYNSKTFLQVKYDDLLIVFDEIPNWVDFKQILVVIKGEEGTTTIHIHFDEGIIWVARFPKHYYYYQTK